jgi:acyl-CoA oxidase
MPAVPTPDWVKQLKPSGAQGHELLKAERANSSVPVQELEVLLHTQDVIDRRNKILNILKAEKVFDKSQNYFMGRTDKFERALAREKRLRILKKQHNWTTEEFRTATELVGEPGPYGLHDSMFKVSLVHLSITHIVC